MPRLKHLHVMCCGSLKKQIRRIKDELFLFFSSPLSLDHTKAELPPVYICMRVY